jgi:VanZ family protein
MRLWLLAPVVCWAGLIFVVSSLSNPPGRPSAEWVSSLAHFAEYSILAFLVGRWLDGQFGTCRLKGLLVIAWALSALYGASDELHQSFVAGRDATPVDWLFDAAGAGVGAGGFWLWSRILRAR